MTAELQPQADGSLAQTILEDERGLAQRCLSLLRRPIRVVARKIRARSRLPAMQVARASTDERLVTPVFVLSDTAAGAAELRSMLRTHSQLLAPDIILDEIQVSFLHAYVERAMHELRLDRDDLRCLLWDRMLHRELVHNARGTVVLVTDAGAEASTQFYARCWPAARFVHLESGDRLTRTQHPGELRIRYADLVRDPEHELRRLCQHLGVRFEPVMLDLAAEGSGRIGR